VLGSCGKSLRNFGEVLKVKDCLRKIAKLLQSSIKAGGKNISTTGLDVAITDSKYKRKK
jgi:hypothetical protein